MAEKIVDVDGVDLCVETFGDPGDPPILLIAGGASPMDHWHPDFCARLAEGRFVIRYDHRDTGRSTCYPPGRPGYVGEDLARDAVALIDLLAGGSAHVVGLSMGGGLAQLLGIEYPDKVRSLTLMSTSSGMSDDLPLPSDAMQAAFADPVPEPDWGDRQAVIDYLVEVERPYSPMFDEKYAREVAERVVSRAVSPASASNHWHAEGGESLRPRLGKVTAPTLVIHGSADPLFPLEHGEALAREIRGASLLVLDGVGHQWPPPEMWDLVVGAIRRHTS